MVETFTKKPLYPFLPHVEPSLPSLNQTMATEAPEDEFDFDALYEKIKDEVSNTIMDRHNRSVCSLAFDNDTADMSTINGSPLRLHKLRGRVSAVSNGYISFLALANKHMVELVARTFEYYTEFYSQEQRDGRTEEDIRERWGRKYSDLRLGFDWETCIQMANLCSIVSEYKRFLFVTTSLFDLAPYAELIQEKLEDETEKRFWSSFGANGRSNHDYMIESTCFKETSDDIMF